MADSKPRRVDTADLRQAALRAGDRLLLSGTLYTARDAAHRRLMQRIDAGEPLPFSLRDAVIYYAGPSPAPPGHAVGSAGPTTSGRMDSFAPRLYAMGVCATIGKGPRSDAVIDALREHHALYLCAVGGAGALMARCVKSCEEVAFSELGCESIKKLVVEDMPLIVGIDAIGGTVFARAGDTL